MKCLDLAELGQLTEMTLEEFAEKVKTALEVDKVRVVGDLSSKVKKVAVLAGMEINILHMPNLKGQMYMLLGISIITLLMMR